jgi:hypothetical protein
MEEKGKNISVIYMSFSYLFSQKKIVLHINMMKRLFGYITKKQDESIFVDSENEEFVTPNISWLHSWSLNETRDALSQSLFNNIPNEIILHIFQFLSVPDLCNVSLVCRYFKIIADQDQLWKSKCDRKSIHYLYYNIITY